MSSDDLMKSREGFTPEQKKLQWCEYVRREQRVCDKAYESWGKPYGTWLKDGEMDHTITYFNNNKKHEDYSEYERLFHLKEGYEMRLHRDDRANRIGLNVNEEVRCGEIVTGNYVFLTSKRFQECKKPVPILSSSVYGARPNLEECCREHVRIESVNKGFYRCRGTNIPSSSSGNL